MTGKWVICFLRKRKWSRNWSLWYCGTPLTPYMAITCVALSRNGKRYFVARQERIILQIFITFFATPKILPINNAWEVYCICDWTKFLFRICENKLINDPVHIQCVYAKLFCIRSFWNYIECPLAFQLSLFQFLVKIYRYACKTILH